MAWYNPINGMVKQGDGPQAPRVTPGPPGGASPWSPWAGNQPGSYESGFEARNYKPKMPTQQPNIYGPQAPPPIQPTPPGPQQLPQTPAAPATGGGTGATQPAGGGVAQINTGIKSGLLPDATIQTAINRLEQGSNAPTLNFPGLGLSPEQQTEMTQNNNNNFTRTFQEQQNNLGRDAAYQQAQMALAHQKAQAGASLQGMGVSGDMYGNDVNRQLQQQQMWTTLFGQLMGGI
jgi:hypothetical protein